MKNFCLYWVLTLLLTVMLGIISSHLWGWTRSLLATLAYNLFVFAGILFLSVAPFYYQPNRITFLCMIIGGAIAVVLYVKVSINWPRVAYFFREP